jgi:aspartate-semialdehyde dehydrogenase
MRVGFVGWRGMVGSVLMDRMKSENDFRGMTPVFFTTSQVGGKGPTLGFDTEPLVSAHDLPALRACDVIVSCQGGDYTTDVHPKLRAEGWKGYFIDAASTLRMKDDAVLVLDPVNQHVIDAALAKGTRDLIGPNCTVSLMLMVMHGPIRQGWVEWISSMTYQSASGAGAKNMQELVAQMQAIGDRARPVLADPAATALDLDRNVSETLLDASYPTAAFGAPLAASLIPWIDKAVEGGRTREEWKGHVEANKILGLETPMPVDGLCVRVGAMRCHSQGLTVKLKRGVPLDEIEQCIRESNPWAKVVPNTMNETKALLSPAAVSGTLDVAIGRIRTMQMGPEYLAAFTVGDQLLWGAAEPLRRVLRQLVER